VKRLDDLATAMVRRWTALYTSGLQFDVREARRAEIASDLWDHRIEARLDGLRPWQTGLEIASRWLVGIPADLSWRRAAPRAVAEVGGGEPRMTRTRSNWWVLSTLALAGMHLVIGLSKPRDPPGAADRPL
jgi:hypothetical protein